MYGAKQRAAVKDRTEPTNWQWDSAHNGDGVRASEQDWSELRLTLRHDPPPGTNLREQNRGYSLYCERACPEIRRKGTTRPVGEDDGLVETTTPTELR